MEDRRFWRAVSHTAFSGEAVDGICGLWMAGLTRSKEARGAEVQNLTEVGGALKLRETGNDPR